MIKHFLALAIAIVAFHQAVAQPINTKRLDSLLHHFADNKKAMGSIAISKNNKQVYSQTFGFAMNDTIKKDGRMIGDEVGLMDNETMFRVGSITKTFTAAMIMQLVEEKKLTLDAKLSKWFPKIPNADKITIEMLLRHRSGLYNFTNDHDYLEWSVNEQTQKQLLERFEKDKPVFPPDSTAEYSNTNFVLLGFILEKVTGKSYADNLQTRIAEPLNLTRTRVGSKINTANNEARSFAPRPNGGWAIEPETHMSMPGGAGVIVSTPHDLNVFINALFNGKVVSDASLKQMTTERDDYGMGLFPTPFNEKKG